MLLRGESTYKLPGVGRPRGGSHVVKRPKLLKILGAHLMTLLMDTSLSLLFPFIINFLLFDTSFLSSPTNSYNFSKQIASQLNTIPITSI